MQKVCEERMTAFGSKGYAKSVPCPSLQEMADAYKKGKYGDSAKPDFSR
jgi:hypothetical protein